MAFKLQLEFIVSATPVRVMELLTDTKLIRAWSGEDAVLEQKAGGKFEMFGGWVKGELLSISDKELSYTWKTTDWDEDATPSEVHYILEKDTEGTKVTLHHNGFPDAEQMEEHKEGWDDQFFGLIEEYIFSTESNR